MSCQLMKQPRSGYCATIAIQQQNFPKEKLMRLLDFDDFKLRVPQGRRCSLHGPSLDGAWAHGRLRDTGGRFSELRPAATG